MENGEFLKIISLVYEDSELDEIINTEPKVYKRLVLVPYANIFFMQEGLDRRETEIILINGETILAYEKIAVIESKWQKWYELNNKLSLYTKSN